MLFRTGVGINRGLVRQLVLSLGLLEAVLCRYARDELANCNSTNP